MLADVSRSDEIPVVHAWPVEFPDASCSSVVAMAVLVPGGQIKRPVVLTTKNIDRLKRMAEAKQARLKRLAEQKAERAMLRVMLRAKRKAERNEQRTPEQVEQGAAKKARQEELEAAKLDATKQAEAQKREKERAEAKKARTKKRNKANKHKFEEWKATWLQRHIDRHAAVSAVSAAPASAAGYLPAKLCAQVCLSTRALPEDNDVEYVMKVLKNLLARFNNRHDLNIVYVGAYGPTARQCTASIVVGCARYWKH